MVIFPSPSLEESIGVDAFTIARLRRQFRSGYDALTSLEKAVLDASGVGARMEFLHREMGFIFSDEQFARWLYHVGLTEYDVTELENDVYQGWTSLFNHYANLFDIEWTFLARGGNPYGETDLRRYIAKPRRNRATRR